MSVAADPGAVASPCISVCVIDPVSGVCGGCFRTLDEIAGWIDFSAGQKREVIAALPGRRASLGPAIAARIQDTMDQRLEDSAQR